MGIEAALASERLMTDGTELLYAYGKRDPETGLSDLVVLRNGQRVFTPAVEGYMQTITYDRGWVRSIRLPQLVGVAVDIDPEINWGQPSLAANGLRVEDILSRMRAGENDRDVADDFELPMDQVHRLKEQAA